MNSYAIRIADMCLKCYKFSKLIKVDSDLDWEISPDEDEARRLLERAGTKTGYIPCRVTRDSEIWRSVGVLNIVCPSYLKKYRHGHWGGKGACNYPPPDFYDCANFSPKS